LNRFLQADRLGALSNIEVSTLKLNSGRAHMGIARGDPASNAELQSGGLYVGVDGCKAGWLCFIVDLDNFETDFRILPKFADVIIDFKCADVVAADIPIGLAECGARACDIEARKRLGKPRSNSVFLAPIRPILSATTYEKACQISLRIDGKKISKQAFGILPKVREVDQVTSPGLRSWVYEVHPELCFWALKGGKAMQFGKLSASGRGERIKLLSKPYPQIQTHLDQLERRLAGPDDLLDAAVAAWTAVRIGQKQAVHLPEKPEFDCTGLRMQISY
jgi:predicted RNase H-like nuclease